MLLVPPCIGLVSLGKFVCLLQVLHPWSPWQFWVKSTGVCSLCPNIKAVMVHPVDLWPANHYAHRTRGRWQSQSHWCLAARSQLGG